MRRSGKVHGTKKVQTLPLNRWQLRHRMHDTAWVRIVLRVRRNYTAAAVVRDAAGRRGCESHANGLGDFRNRVMPEIAIGYMGEGEAIYVTLERACSKELTGRAAMLGLLGGKKEPPGPEWQLPDDTLSCAALWAA